MKLAKNAFIYVLAVLFLATSVFAQAPRSAEDPRNTAPTVGTGGPMGGPTGLFTIYDGQTLRRGEYTFSVAYSNFDRDPGDVDITEVPVSFQIGLSDNIELFFNTDAYRGVKVNSPQNLSSFYLPNSQLRIGNSLCVPGAIVLAPQGTAANPATNQAAYRAPCAPFVQYPYVGGNFGRNGIPTTFGTINGVPTPVGSVGYVFGFGNADPTYGAAVGGSGNAASNFPGVGSVYGSILPGIVYGTQNLTLGTPGITITTPTAYTTAPSYLPDAPFINRTYGQSAFSTMTAGAKIRFTNVNNPVGFGIIPFYRFYMDKANDFAGFNQLQRGASPGGNGNFARGDIGGVLFLDGRLRKWLNMSGNVGYIWNSSVKSGDATLLDRPDEMLYGVGLDFPVNQYFQPILEFRGTRYMGGRTPNAFENNPMDGLAGVRIFPRRWFGMGFAYRYHFNQQDADSLEDVEFNRQVLVVRPTSATNLNEVTYGTYTGTTSLLNGGFRPSSDPHGFIAQFFIGRRNSRGSNPPLNQFANVTALDLDSSTVVIPCPPGTRSASGGCNDDGSLAVRTTAVDAENDVLTYNYTVSGGRIVGTGANVNWDLTGVRPGTYTITSAVDDGCGFCGQTQTKTITVTECTDCVKICECPTVSVTGPSSSVESGQRMTFTANVTGGTQTSVTYNWTVTAGSIVEGQGTPSITVDTTGLTGQTVTATAEVSGGDLCDTCRTLTASATGEVTQPPIPTARRINEFGALSNDEVRAQVDALIVELQNDPTATATVFNFGTPAQVRNRERLMRNHLRFRGADETRVTFVNGGTGELNTRIWIVPANAAQPTPEM